MKLGFFGFLVTFGAFGGPERDIVKVAGTNDGCTTQTESQLCSGCYSVLRRWAAEECLERAYSGSVSPVTDTLYCHVTWGDRCQYVSGTDMFLKCNGYYRCTRDSSTP